MLLFGYLEDFVSLLDIDLSEGVGIAQVDPTVDLQSFCVEGENFELLGAIV